MVYPHPIAYLIAALFGAAFGVLGLERLVLKLQR